LEKYSTGAVFQNFSIMELYSNADTGSVVPRLGLRICIFNKFPIVTGSVEAEAKK
jgi:hypothetical protein